MTAGVAVDTPANEARRRAWLRTVRHAAVWQARIKTSRWPAARADRETDRRVVASAFSATRVVSGVMR